MSDSSLLIVHQGALGDFVAIFPVVLRLKKAYARIDVLCQSQLGKLAAALGLADRWFGLESAYFASLYTDQVDPKIVALLKPYTIILLFSFSSRLEQSLNRITGQRCHRIPPKPPARDRIRVAEYALGNLIRSGLLEKNEGTLDTGFAAIGEKGGAEQPVNRRRILIHPGAGSIRKRWSLAGFLSLATRLKADGLKPEFIIGPAERDLTDSLCNSQDPERTVHILSDILDLLALLKSAGAYIGNDSGVSHLAAFLSLPTTIVFGPADPRRWIPFGRSVEVVRPELECEPCFETENANCPHPQCLIETMPDKVLEAFNRVYRS